MKSYSAVLRFFVAVCAMLAAPALQAATMKCAAANGSKDFAPVDIITQPQDRNVYFALLRTLGLSEHDAKAMQLKCFEVMSVNDPRPWTVERNREKNEELLRRKKQEDARQGIVDCRGDVGSMGPEEVVKAQLAGNCGPLMNVESQIFMAGYVTFALNECRFNDGGHAQVFLLAEAMLITEKPAYQKLHTAGLDAGARDGCAAASHLSQAALGYLDRYGDVKGEKTFMRSCVARSGMEQSKCRCAAEMIRTYRPDIYDRLYEPAKTYQELNGQHIGMASAAQWSCGGLFGR